MESLRSQASGYQEEGFSEMMGLSADRDPRRQGRAEKESIYGTVKEKHTREASAQRPQIRETEEKEEGTKTKPREKREPKTHEIEAKNLGLKVYSCESYRFPKKSTYEEIVDGVKRGKYKITFTDKRNETEIISMMERGKLKFEDL